MNETDKINENIEDRHIQRDIPSDSTVFSDEAREYIQDLPQSTDKNNAFVKRVKRGAGVLLLTSIVSLAAYFTEATRERVDTSDAAAQALETHMSSAVGIGTVLLEEDQNYVGGDLVITHSARAEETTIWIWDYAAEDGDYVQVLVDGTAIGAPFRITNRAVSFTVPAVGEIQVLGTRDGGGGITYAVYYELNQTTYFNGMNQGGSNLYTLIRE